MDFSEWTTRDKILFAALHPAQARRLAEEERFVLSVAAVPGAPFSATVAITKALCEEFGIHPEALRFRLARGDRDMWGRAEALKTMWAQDAAAPDSSEGEG